MNSQELALKHEILRGIVGSTAHGLDIPGQSDIDEMGICMEPADYVCGLNQFENYNKRDQKQGLISQPNDEELTIYSLRRYCSLAAAGNPTIILLMYLPKYTVYTDIGERLLNIRDAFHCKSAGKRFGAYLRNQKRILLGEKGGSRPDRVERYGYDTKLAMHAIRLGMQGLEYIRDRNITLPMDVGTRSMLLDVRTGHISLEHVLATIDHFSNELDEVTEACTAKADMQKINNFLVEEHLNYWDKLC